MQRTKFTNQSPGNQPAYDVLNEPLILSKPLMDILLKESQYANLVALYSFYYYTAKWQSTTIIKATTTYVSVGMNWTIQKVRRTKDRLKELKLIEDVVIRDNQNKVSGHFVKVHLVWSHPTEKPPGGTNHPVEKSTPNAYIYNNINALIKDNKIPHDKCAASDIKEKNVPFLPLAKYLSRCIQFNKNITHTTKQLATWTNDIRLLIQDHKIPYERVEAALQWYRKNIGGQYIPVIESGRSLREKFFKLEAAMDRDKAYHNTSNSKPKTKIIGGERYTLSTDGQYYNSDGQLLRD